jgi:hypothetical protein
VQRVLYFNMMGLMLAVLDETVASMSINFAGVRVTRALAGLMSSLSFLPGLSEN